MTSGFAMTFLNSADAMAARGFNASAAASDGRHQRLRAPTQSRALNFRARDYKQTRCSQRGQQATPCAGVTAAPLPVPDSRQEGGNSADSGSGMNLVEAEPVRSGCTVGQGVAAVAEKTSALQASRRRARGPCAWAALPWLSSALFVCLPG